MNALAMLMHRHPLPFDGHRTTTRGPYIGACALAGLFTLQPGRFLGSLLWGRPMNGIAY